MTKPWILCVAQSWVQYNGEGYPHPIRSCSRQFTLNIFEQRYCWLAKEFLLLSFESGIHTDSGRRRVSYMASDQEQSIRTEEARDMSIKQACSYFECSFLEGQRHI